MPIINSKYNIIGSLETRQGGRSENQDFLGFIDTPIGFLLVVCDGMGGGPGGRTASTTTVDLVTKYMGSLQADAEPRKALVDAVKLADENISNICRENPSLTGMGTTIVALLVAEDAAYVAHVGDSRLYQFRFGKKIFRTTDHSVVGEMVRQGVLTEEQARLSSQSNIITRAINGRGIAKPDIDILSYERGDRFMLCTDGIWGAMPEKELMAKVVGTKNINGAVAQLAFDVDELGVVQGSTHDNLTISIVETKTDSKIKPKMSRKTRILFTILVAVLGISLLLNIFSAVSSDSEKEALCYQIDSLQKIIIENRTDLEKKNKENDNLKDSVYSSKQKQLEAEKEATTEKLKAANAQLQAEKAKSQVPANNLKKSQNAQAGKVVNNPTEKTVLKEVHYLVREAGEKIRKNMPLAIVASELKTLKKKMELSPFTKKYASECEKAMLAIKRTNTKEAIRQLVIIENDINDRLK